MYIRKEGNGLDGYQRRVEPPTLRMGDYMNTVQLGWHESGIMDPVDTQRSWFPGHMDSKVNPRLIKHQFGSFG